MPRPRHGEPSIALGLDPGRGAEQHEAVHEVRSGEGQMQRQAAAHRVADIDGLTTRRAEECGAGREVGHDAVEPPWPGASTVTTSWSRARSAHPCP